MNPYIKAEAWRRGREMLRLPAARQGGWMFLAVFVTGFLNYLANVAVGRLLGPADYSIYASLLSIFLMLTAATGIIQTVVTTYMASAATRDYLAEASSLLLYVLKRFFYLGIIGALFFLLISKPLAAFLRIPSLLPVIALSPTFLLASVAPAISGALRGLQRFGPFGGVQISGAALRLFSGLLLISLGLGAAGAVSSFFFANLGTVGLGVLFLADVLRPSKNDSKPQLEGIWNFSLHTALALVCFAALTNLDVVMVKSRFSPTEAGYYSAVATLGKIALYFPNAVVLLLLPKAAARHARGEPSADLLKKSLLVVSLLCGGITLWFLLFPSFTVRILFGEKYLANASLLGWYGLAMTFYALVNVQMFYYLAVQKMRYTYLLLGGAILLMLALSLPGLSLGKVVFILISVGFALNVTGSWIMGRPGFSRSS
ncbi:MAG: oligosaccharide flippase family protein [Anaerolineae bacterium]